MKQTKKKKKTKNILIDSINLFSGMGVGICFLYGTCDRLGWSQLLSPLIIFTVIENNLQF